MAVSAPAFTPAPAPAPAPATGLALALTTTPAAVAHFRPLKLYVECWMALGG